MERWTRHRRRMDAGEPSKRERRWVVVAEDGRYATLGRETDPSEDETAAAEKGLEAAGTGGWLAIMEGKPYVGEEPTLLEVRTLAKPSTSFATATEALLADIRRARMDGPEVPTS